MKFTCEKCGKGSIDITGDAMILLVGNGSICCNYCRGKLIRIIDVLDEPVAEISVKDDKA